MADLRIKIGSLLFKNPVLMASGTCGYGSEMEDFIDLAEIGGIIVKGTTLEPREGNAYPRMAETASGMLNAVGLQNKGIDYFERNIYPLVRGEIQRHPCCGGLLANQLRPAQGREFPVSGLLL